MNALSRLGVVQAEGRPRMRLGDQGPPRPGRRGGVGPPRGSGLFQRATRSALADQLVETPGPLPAFHPQAGGVGVPHALPSLIPYGSQPQGLVQNSRFTGGAVPSPMSLTPGDQTPGFVEPTYGAPSPISPVGPSRAGGVSPLAAALASASALAPAATGATAPAAPPQHLPPAGPAPILSPYQPPAVPGQGNPAGAPGSAGGYKPASGAMQTGLSALLAALAQQGRKATSFQIGRVE